MKTNEKFTKRLRNALNSNYPHKSFYVSTGDDLEDCRIYIIKQYEKKFLWFFQKPAFKRIYLGEIGACAQTFEINLEIENKKFIRFLEDVSYEYFGDDVVWLNEQAYQRAAGRYQRRIALKTMIAMHNDEPEDFNIKGAL